ncbi:hypothetical protein DEU56DRAFT_948079, partial [Suillus clintonianus]|uniref:uncharacterized protein n=1 Tax=Suillus clintonianus TaxID=1904413 RepID=UPI001B8804DF
HESRAHEKQSNREPEPRTLETYTLLASRTTRAQHSFPFTCAQKPLLIMSSLSRKTSKKKSIPQRGEKGRFIKKTDTSSDTLDCTSEDSSPLDTPEINKRTLDQETSQSEQEVDNQLIFDDDEESLAGAPNPNTIIPIPEQPAPFTAIPFPATQPPQRFTSFSTNIAKPAQKTRAQPIVSLKPIQYTTMANVPAPSTFKGIETENPQNFLREVERYIYLNRITDETTKVIIFMQDAGVTNAPVFIHQVREGLPRVIRDLTSPAPATWTAFLDEIKNADVDVIQDKARREKETKEAEKAQNARIARLENKQTDPVEILRLQMQRASIGPASNTMQIATAQPRPQTPTSNQNLPARRQLRYVAANQNAQGPRARGTFNRATAPQINIVFDNLYTLETEEQGNGNGSSV